jgi:hypothetical protein
MQKLYPCTRSELKCELNTKRFEANWFYCDEMLMSHKENRNKMTKSRVRHVCKTKRLETNWFYYDDPPQNPSTLSGD